MPFIHIASSIPMLISVKVSSQFQISTIMSISKLLWSCQFHTLAVMSINFNLFFAIPSVSVIGQVATSHPRTACACQFTSIIGQAASSNTRTACTCTLFLPSAKWLVRIQEQLVPLLLVSIPGQVPSSSQKNNLHLSICYLVSPVNLIFAILLMSTNPAMDTTYSVICYSVNVYQSRNGYDILCYLLFC